MQITLATIRELYEVYEIINDKHEKYKNQFNEYFNTNYKKSESKGDNNKFHMNIIKRPNGKIDINISIKKPANTPNTSNNGEQKQASQTTSSQKESNNSNSCNVVEDNSINQINSDLSEISEEQQTSTEHIHMEQEQQQEQQQQQQTKSSEIDPKLYSLKKKHIKMYYTKIVIRTHPDKHVNQEDLMEKMTRLFSKALEYYEQELLTGLIKVADEVNINIKEFPKDLSPIMEMEMNEILIKINRIKNSVEWLWSNSQNTELKGILERVIVMNNNLKKM
jgi:hypothetical protein